jgi:DNA-binding transcriptional ArsR family regulator
MNSDETLHRLDDMIALLKVGFSREIESVRQALGNDLVNKAIIEALSDGWMASGDLQRQISASTKVTERTVRQRLADLTALGVLRSRGAGRSTEYSLSGIL